MLLESKYDIGDILYLKTDQDQKQRMVTQINFSGTGVRYELSCGSVGSWHYEIECSAEKDVLQTTSN